MRRLLIMLAMTMRLSAVTVKTKPGNVHKSAPLVPRGAGGGDIPVRSPLFSVFEPQPTLRSLPLVKEGIKGPMPRIRMIDLEALAAPNMLAPAIAAPISRIDPLAPTDSVRLARRVQALQDVLQRPGFHVARMARQITRLKNAVRSTTPPKRTGLISPVRVPGSHRKRHGLGYHDFYALHRAALGAYRCDFDSS